MISLQRAEQRFRTDDAGITSRHCFSSGAHYDPDNVAFGPLVACDEHLLDPGAGFARHPHARVELVTWVVDGLLQHSDDSGRARIVVPGQVQYQLAGHGIAHAEVNASDSEPLHFVQLWLMTDEPVPDYDRSRPPATLVNGRFDVLRTCHDQELALAGSGFLFLAAGAFSVDGEQLRPGDSVRVSAERPRVEGAGELLVLTMP